MNERTGGPAHPAPDAPSQPPRAIARRVGLPTGRAVVGALLVAISVVGLFAAFRRSQAATGSPFVVVAKTIPAGAVVEPDHLALRVMDIGELGPTTYTSIDQAAGSVAIQTLVPGQLLQEANVLPEAPGSDDNLGGAGTTEISFSVDRSRALNGSLSPGEVVDVLATLDESGQTCAIVVAPKARVVAVRGGGSEVLATSSRDLTVTLSLDDDTSILGVVFAVDEADITIARATRSQSDSIEGSFCGNTAVPPVSDEATDSDNPD